MYNDLTYILSRLETHSVPHKLQTLAAEHSNFRSFSTSREYYKDAENKKIALRFVQRFEWEIFETLAEKYPGLEKVKLEIDPTRSVSVLTTGVGPREEFNVGWGCFPPQRPYVVVISRSSHGSAFHRAKYGYQDTLGTLGWIKGRGEVKDAPDLEDVLV